MSLRDAIIAKIAGVLTEYVQAFLAIITTLIYMGSIFLCLLYATIPVYQNDFEMLLKWSVVPGFVWGAYFTTRAVQQILKREKV